MRRGGARPQASSVPAYTDTAGHEAIDLARQAGLIADEWQNNVIVDSLGERPDGKWAAFEVGLLVGRQNGKGSILEIRTLAGLTLFDERLILWSAHETKTAFEAFRRMVSLFENNDDLRRRVKKISYAAGSEGIELTNGCRLRFVARTKGSGRGFTGDLIILDEAYAVTAEQMDALLPTLAARPNPQIWYTSSPPLDGATGDQLYALRERAKAGDDSLAWFDWGYQDVDLEDLQGVDLDDPDLWAATNPAFGIRISEQFIGRERRALTTEGFARERLGIWPKQLTAESAAIDLDLWQALADRESKRAGAVAIAVDITPMRDRAAIGVAGLRSDGLMHWEVIEDRPGVDWLVQRLVELKTRHDPVAVCIDGKGPGASLITALGKAGITTSEQRDEPRRGDLVVSGPQDMADAFGMFVDAARQSQGRHRDQGPLTSALAGAKTRPCGDGGMAWGRKGSANIAPLVAVTLAHWAYETRAHLIVEATAPNIW